jgi:5'-3' exoribonuclease 2
MGKTITDTERNKTAWDSNAITPGTPFMDLLAQSLRYWVVQKANTDPGWANVRMSFLLTVHMLSHFLCSCK